MNENDPRLIVTLKADGTLAERAWNLLENRDRCQPVSGSDGGVEDPPSRGTTPSATGEDASKIRLTFDKKPKNLEKGFVFGSDPKTCDVLLGEYKAGFSRQHFRITFNAQGQVILENKSRRGTCVNYKGEKPFVRNHFTWILFDDYENIKVTLNKKEDPAKKKNTNELIFKVEVPNNRKSAEYQAYREAYLEERRNAPPPLSQLGMESPQTTAVPTGQRSARQESPRQESPRQKPPGQQPIYLPKEKLGRGSFGAVYKVIDVSTGDEYAAKRLHHGDWKKEVEILESVSHEYIVKFVNFSEEQKCLVTEYLPFGNLACQDFITEEENLKILYQGLDALEYLHSHTPPIAHRDIKPENILLLSRIPFVIKLADFGFAKNESPLKTFCGTDEYAAPELWEHCQYTVIVDIWSLGVVIFQYGYGLPKPSNKCKGKSWCEDIVKAVEDMEGEGDALIDLISTKMLKMDYRERQSASGCLREVYRLGFDAIETAEIGRTTPTGQTSDQDGVTRTKSVITQPFQNAPSNSDVSSGFYDLAGASETTEVAPSKRDVREEVHFYNPAPPRSTQMRSSQTKEKATSTRSKRRRPQTTQSPTADAMGRGQSKRLRASVSCEASEQLPKALNSRQGPQQLVHSIGSKHEGLATEVSRREIEKPSSKCNIQDHVRAMMAGNLEEENEGKPKVTDFDTRHVQMKIEDKIVLMRKEDCFLNVTQILALSNKDPSDSERLLQRMEQNIKVEVLPPMKGVPYSCFWINFEHGQIICKHLGTEQQLQPLIDHGFKLQRDNNRKAIGHVNNLPTEQYSQFFAINVLSRPVTVRRSDFRIRANDICRASKRQPRTEMAKIQREFRGDYDILNGSIHKGTYVDVWVALELCRRYGLTELEKELHTRKDVPQELVKESELPELEPSKFIEITGFSSPVMVQTLGFRINASHIIKVAGHTRTEVASLRKRLGANAYEILRGSTKHQGTYVNFDIGLKLCGEYGLPELEKRLYSLKHTLEGPVLDIEPHHIRHRSQTFKRLPESFGSDAVSARNESTQSREIWNHDQPLTPSGEPITNGPMQAEDAYEIDSDSDVIDSGGSVTSHEPCSIQRKPQPVPSIHYASKSQSDSSDPEDDIGVEDLGKKYPISDAASESSTSSSETSTERESEPSSVHLGAAFAPFHQQSSLKETERQSPPAKNSHYSVWNSQSEHSRLSLFNPDLKPPSGTSSPYESFTNF